jgi:hypothetical protein
VRAVAEVALGQERVPEQRNRRCRDRADDGHRRQRGREPDDDRKGEHQLRRRANAADAERRQQPHAVETVSALGHVGDRPAVKIPIAQQGNLLVQRGAQPRFEPRTQTSFSGGEDPLAAEQDGADDRQRRH